jgi:lipopolysaccharide export system protein LptA
MKRRSFLAAFAPIAALAAPVMAQLPGDDSTGRLKPKAPAAPVDKPAVAGDKTAAAGDKAVPTKGPTEITAAEAMLDNKSNLAVFSGQVDVNSPEYKINCDKLTIYLKPEKAKAGPVKVEQPRPIGAEEPVAKPAENGEKGKGGNGRIDKGIAEGNVRILQDKPAEPGAKLEKVFATAKKAVFDNNKQTCTLTGWPRVQQSENGKLVREIVPLEEGVVIVLAPDRIDVLQGRATTRLIEDDTFEGPKTGNR